MATIKFLIQSKSNRVPIYVRLSKGRGNIFYRKTGLFVEPINWSERKGFAKQNDENNKKLNSDLKGLEKFLFDELNISESTGVRIEGNWLSSKIDVYFGRAKKEELDYLTVFSEKFIEELKYKKNRNGDKISEGTIKKYKSISNKLKEFEKYKNKRFLVKDVGLNFKRELIEFFYEDNKLSEGSIGRYLKTVKTFCLGAELYGIETSPQLKSFKGFAVKSHKIILSFEEIEKIKKAELVKESHIIARDWLIIGCFTGQRVSDLLRMNKDFIKTIQSFNFIELIQQKTKKLVQIPIHYEVANILEKRNGDFPPIFSKNIDSNKAMFNRYLKELCEVAELNEIIKGKGYDKELKRYIEGDFEKHKLISSHICRRSFATNFYGDPKYPTPVLMNITAHSTEKDFLLYIGKKPLDYGIQLAKIFANEALKEKNKENPPMEIVKKVSNQ